jgi:hypothetical protein
MTRQRQATTGRSTVDALLQDLPLAALECRELRHAWSRGQKGQTRLTPTKRRGNRILEAERQMECTGGCGVIRIDLYSLSNDGRLLREGKPRYRYTRNYRIKRETLPPGEVRETVDRDRVRMIMFERMFPTFRW